jgi:hypothetical protein
MERGKKKINISENNIISVEACQGSKCNFFSFLKKNTKTQNQRKI